MNNMTTTIEPTHADIEHYVPVRDRLRVALGNLRNLHIRIAYRILSRAMQKDRDYAEAWQANIAMPIYDASRWSNEPVSHATCNAIADHLMRHLFRVKR